MNLSTDTPGLETTNPADFGYTPSIRALQARIEEREALAREIERLGPGNGPLIVSVGNKAFFNLK